MKNYLKRVLPLLAIVFAGVFTSCSDDEKLSDLTGFLTFGFSDKALADYEFTIGNDGIITNAIALPYGFDASALTPIFTAAPAAKVFIGEEEQKSGSKAMNFTKAIAYKVVAEDGVTTKTYNVKVNVAETLSAWTNLAPDAKYPDYTSVVAFKLSEKYFIMGGKKGASGYGGHTYGIFSSTDGASFEEVNTNIFKEYGMGLGAAVVKHGEKQLLIGGYTPSDYEVWGETGNGAGINTVWSSTDGTTWEKVNETATKEQKFTARTNAMVANLKGDLYLASGYSVAFGAPQQAIGDVWKSTDGGATWVQLEANFGEEFKARTEGKLLVYNNELYLIGGKTGYPYTCFNEIYKSADGVNWTKLNVATPFTERYGFSCFVYNNRMYVVAGGNYEKSGKTTKKIFYNDIWVSEDGGLNWKEVTDGGLPAGFPARAGVASTIEENNIHLFGGNTVDSEDKDKVLTDAWKGTLN